MQLSSVGEIKKGAVFNATLEQPDSKPMVFVNFQKGGSEGISETAGKS